jgi:hypothetical protein
MHKRRTPGAKRDPAKRWAFPDRVFFAAGACHMLAYAFLERYPLQADRCLRAVVMPVLASRD